MSEPTTGMPLVSIIIPTYNYAGYIIEAIESVLQQNYPPDRLQIVVVDDGSSDNTHQVLQPYIAKNQVLYHYQQNRGKAAATAEAVKRTTGKYIFNLDADDYFFKDKISLITALFESDAEIVHIGNAAAFVIDGKDAGREHFPPEICDRKIDGTELLRYYYNHATLFGGGSTFAARGDVLRGIHIPDAVDMYIDEFVVLAVLNKGSGYLLSEPLSVWRGHSENYTVKSTSKDNKLQRLDNSSKGILDEVIAGAYPKEISKLYALKHASRHIFFMEQSGKKTMGDIFAFAKFCFIANMYPFKQLKTYSAFNRLLPVFMIDILKKILGLRRTG